MQLTSFSALQGLGLSPALMQQALRLARPELRLVRIIEPQRTNARVHDGEQSFDAVCHPSFAGELRAAGDTLVVGDWAGVDPDQYLHLILPRQGLIQRSSFDGSTQTLAAHIDLALLVMGLDNDYSPNRLQRYLMLVRQGGISPVVVLSKRDRNPQFEECVHDIQALVGPDVPVHAIDARAAGDTDILQGYSGLGRTLVLLGSSGVGKSTITNALSGAGQLTQATRAYDDRGRHTTTTRTLHQLADGGCLIDTPGLRELRLAGTESLDDAGFDDVMALAAQCRFSDCRHRQEPGCAVREQVSERRLAHFHKLQDEIEQAQADALARQKQRGQQRVQQRSLRRLYRERDK